MTEPTTTDRPADPLMLTLAEARRLTAVDDLFRDVADQRGERQYDRRVEAGDLDDRNLSRRDKTRFLYTLAGDYAYTPLIISKPKEVADVELLRFLRPRLTHAEAVALLGYDDAPPTPEPWSVRHRAALERVAVTKPPPRTHPPIRPNSDHAVMPRGRWRKGFGGGWIRVMPGQERDSDLVVGPQ